MNFEYRVKIGLLQKCKQILEKKREGGNYSVPGKKTEHIKQKKDMWKKIGFDK